MSGEQMLTVGRVLISEARAVILWLRSSCLDANEGHRSSGHRSARKVLGCPLVHLYDL